MMFDYAAAEGEKIRERKIGLGVVRAPCAHVELGLAKTIANVVYTRKERQCSLVDALVHLRFNVGILAN